MFDWHRLPSTRGEGLAPSASWDKHATGLRKIPPSFPLVKLTHDLLVKVAGYQQQFPGAPYGQVVPSSVGPQGFGPNYMMAGGMQGFPMNQAGMPQQPQMMHRLPQQPQQQQPPPNPAAMGQVGTPQRPPSAAQGTPNNAVPSQPGQFSTPQPPSQGQTPTNQQQPSAGMSTPQTPTFSVNQSVSVNGGSAVGTPLSPGTESRDKERFALLLDINHELLYESIQIQATQQELKKEHAAEGNGNGNGGDKKPTEEETLFQQDYLQYVNFHADCRTILTCDLDACDGYRPIFHTWQPWRIGNPRSRRLLARRISAPLL